ncbi:MAG: glycoside hydrolase family 36 protein [Candidatus Onthomonas sp.]
MADKPAGGLLHSFVMGDMVARYWLEGSGQVELLLLPADREQTMGEAAWREKQTHGDSLAQVKLVGDAYPGSYAGGTSLRNSETVSLFRYESQSSRRIQDRLEVETCLTDGRGHRLIHTLTWTVGDYAVDSRTTFANEAEEPASLELLSSFSLGQITPYEPGDAPDCLKLHRIRSKWSQEGRLVTESAEELQLEPSWGFWQVNSVRYGQIGSMPVKGYAPFGAVEDRRAGVIWAAQLAVETSWQMEFYRRDDCMAFSGGLADREFGHWMKTIRPGESFTTPKAILTVCSGVPGQEDTCLVDCACQRLTQYGEKYVEAGPACEQTLPILFNEYCTTWGLPSHENIAGILSAIKGKGFDYFVIDCGWFVEEGRNWSDGMGDYVPSCRLFPEGLGAVCEDIRRAGMRPGIWFEIDNVGRDARVYQEERLLLHRDGRVLTTQNRRFFDLRKPETEAYLSERVIGLLKRYGFAYMKMDYNDTIGLGCDGAESLGEGLRQEREASVAFVRKVKRETPGIILENCASGGHKLEPLMMSLCSMASFSDAHECEEIPVIAAALHRCILPRQSQIWAVIRKSDSLRRIGYTMANAFLGRMCLSGDVTELTDAQWKAIEDGIAFYRSIAPVIKDGFSYFYGSRGPSDRHLTGWQGVVRVQREKGHLTGGPHAAAYATVHFFRGEVPEQITIGLPENCPNRIAAVYAPTGIRAELTGRSLTVWPAGEMEAIGIYLK